MKKIILKHISLLNFKGIRSLDIDFNESITTISGRNGTGKTSVMDAFTWVLFGKDSRDRKQFNIKTFDENGAVIEQLPHEVTAILLVDGTEVRLCRRYEEIWRTPTGGIKPEFKGHEETRLYNDVPCNTKEWKEKIDAIVGEDIFKYITNPAYFSSRKADEQRRMLFKMAGGITDEEVASGKDNFKQLLTNLNGKTMEEYKREITNKKKRLKDEASGIPARIDERKRSMPEPEDWTDIEAKIREKDNELQSIEKETSNILAAYDEADKQRKVTADEIASLNKKRVNRMIDIKKESDEKYYTAKQKENQRDADIRNKESEIKRLNEDLDYEKRVVDDCKEKRNKLLGEWKEINDSAITFDENEFICPTCKRRLDIADIEKKQEEIEGNFNKKKAEQLAENKRQGVANNERMEKSKAKINQLEADIESKEREIKVLRDMKFDTIEKPDTDAEAKNDPEIIRIDKEIESLKKELEEDTARPDTTELQQRKNAVQNEITDLKIRLSKKDDIEEGNKRISDLENQLRSLNCDIAELEGIENTMFEFNKRRTTLIEDRVNGLFKYVKFKLFDTQVNGAEIETCVATIKGVPYDDGLNQAATVNAGIDIINAICRHVGICAPLFVDQSESINTIIPTESQLIKLRVSEDARLVIN